MSQWIDASVFEHLAAGVLYADKDKVLRYVNPAAREGSPGTAEALGKDIEGCHNPASVEKIRAYYAEWAAGGREVKVTTREADGRRYHYVYIPVHGPEGFRGVMEVTFNIAV